MPKDATENERRPLKVRRVPFFKPVTEMDASIERFPLAYHFGEPFYLFFWSSAHSC